MSVLHGWPAGAFVLLLGLTGCKPDGSCPDGSPCRGDPTGSWNVVNACRDPVYAAPLPVTYLGQPVGMARQPNPTMTSSDWCSSLIIGSTAAVTSFSFPHDTLAIAGGQLTYANDSDDPQQPRGTYQAVINTTGSGAIHLSPACLTRSGANLSCEMVAAALAEFAAIKPTNPGVPCSDSPGEPAYCQFYYSYQDISCAGLSGGGCRCTYGVSFAGTLNGRWSTAGGLLTHSDASKMLPSQADYCVDGQLGALTLWGHDRTSILNQAGIRTLELQRAAP